MQVKREELLELASSAQLLGASQPICKRRTGCNSEGHEELQGSLLQLSVSGIHAALQQVSYCPHEGLGKEEEK